MPNIIITGDKELDRALKNAGDLTEKAAAAALFQIGNTLMNVSQSQVPVDQGTLRASGTVNNPVISNGNVSVMLGYGGAASAYAEVQHENLQYSHDDGKAKYLEDPLLDYAPDFPADLANAIEMALRVLRVS